MTDDLLREHVRNCLTTAQTREEALQDLVETLEAHGYRIVTAVQTGYAKWEIRDFRAETCLMHGNQGSPELAKQMERISISTCEDQHWTWVLIEDLLDGLPSDPIITPGMPASLGAMIAEWVRCPATPLDEIVMITGWSVGRVQSFL